MVLGFFFGGKNRRGRPKRRETLGILRPYDKDKIAQEWGRIEQLVATSRPSACKEAVIAADKLLDYALVQIVSGEAMGERLKNAFEAFPRDTYQGLWDAHKMRNALVHEAGFDLTVLVAKDVLGKFKRGFQYLGVRL
ncbi:MAG: hypothetical protein BMS9Abin34_323 [Patescibacteria group bacterium]|nr:MAG: hypothetical protein BMS9Abin34_323 [Patescibacteria group bacterium]